ncbi:hypothetical protein [Nocardia sp. NPDC057353]|uniref:hypothetical protein n=1 Tax=Nocardia sp. NPDC057353 TaxID=3346104 RepID=UPI003631D264
MSPKRGERVAPPAVAGTWELRFATSEAAKGWEDLCQQAPANVLDTWELLRGRADAHPEAIPPGLELTRISGAELGEHAWRLHTERELVELDAGFPA